MFAWKTCLSTRWRNNGTGRLAHWIIAIEKTKYQYYYILAGPIFFLTAHEDHHKIPPFYPTTFFTF